ncbi:Crp/Fnr family transcriptional regulator [Aurantimonas coralicida]|uniref:Crp/Fnr family transcriptional regulator n=1 Tax=Aurantimonas coralicida TaxID=182270 RepID=UPI000462A9F7|nr:Crp/Fnr family transcriptional regulator [Aurantimonas coralicida]
MPEGGNTVHNDSGHIRILIRRLQRSTGLNEEELADLRSLPIQVREVGRNETISHEGDRVDHCMLVVNGFVARYQDTREGMRQILSFYVPGDIPDLQTLHLATMDHSVASITAGKVAMIPHGALHDICDRNSRIASALWRETLIDAAIARTWLRCLGRQQAHSRIAHILCELYTRLNAVGLAEHPIRMPFTQAEFADATGLSVVQVNRTLRELREEELITVRKREMVVHDLARLQHVAEFDPLYLHLDPAQRR